MDERTGHTPGEWTFAPIKYTRASFVVFHQTKDDGRMDVAEVWSHPDAALIAAAPELLAACEDALGTLTHAPLESEEDRIKWPVRQTIEKLQAAVAKARGRGGSER